MLKLSLDMFGQCLDCLCYLVFHALSCIRTLIIYNIYICILNFCSVYVPARFVWHFVRHVVELFVKEINVFQHV